ncbi:MAG: nickel pincer cofactor biosynthesis protein LarB [Proteobacteria bacterium]|nr:nickel pincer cofactor biosynthesis protein LarB [Pseudomonadota bacterium]
MKPELLRQLLEKVQQRDLAIDDALEALATLPFGETPSATIDHHRALRTGLPEAVFGETKTAAQIVEIATAIIAAGQDVLVTRVSPEKAAQVRHALPDMNYEVSANALVHRTGDAPNSDARGTIVVVTAGTSDLSVAHEALLTAELAGHPTHLINDVGIAGLHRLLHHLPRLRDASVIIAVAGMEGALPSVVASLVSCPVIAVPTSVGYGVSRGGFVALLSMLSTCVPGVTLVNIDNGYGAGCAASLINRNRNPHAPESPHTHARTTP